ncbi:hypothetical protein HXZ94_15620 [Empedobacter falsenii]|uniref:hypothetical protein n=1 Tax=Empedobacter falsenii TaxID=343874 RepID=UPI002574DBAB|nr:hypothetical protein [Empedobacter falsenii]MDM1299924.1 hypothetical protein [Empedobacter falsenii]MDM1319717.1 hypothetical protein [Empedobacter falsenii]
MAKVTITKTLVEKNSQLAELLAERKIEVGSKIEQSELDELYKVLEATELKELTQEHFDAEPALADKGLKVGDKVRITKKAELEGESGELSQEGSENKTAKPYKVIARFRDKENDSKIFEIGEEIPAEFEEARIADLLSRKLISEA